MHQVFAAAGEAAQDVVLAGLHLNKGLVDFGLCLHLDPAWRLQTNAGRAA